MKLFKELTQAEEREMRQWARDHYRPFSEIQGVWHPVVQAECVEINKEGILGGDVWFEKETPR